MHRSVMQSRLVDMSMLVLERPENEDEDVIFVCDRMLENYKRWRMEAEARIARKQRRAPSGTFRPAVVDEETR